MATKDFLLEIGVEEIPDWMIEEGLGALQAKVQELIAPLSGWVSMAEATPRRLVIGCRGIAEREADREEILSGPPKQANPQAVEGFAKKCGVAVADLELIESPKGTYYSFRKKVKGKTAIEIFSGSLPGIILGIPWPKTMLWPGKGGARFIRPIRWLLCLLGEEVVPFSINGIATKNETSGHRQLGEYRVAVSIDNFEQTLRDNFVLLRGEERRAKIEAELPPGVKADEKLLHTLTYITEFPTPIVGDFAASYLSLPEEVLVTVMRFHQKYFSVADPEGGLVPKFVAVMNTASDPEGLVKHGNERVLRARFNDARFFYDVDQQKPLAARVEDLKVVTFQKELGSYHAKTERVMALVQELGGDAATVRAAELAKTDLTCEMVKEFTELQGIVGGLYAKAQGESAEVGDAIYDHYKPVSMEDSIPRTRAGQLLSLADKVDTLRGCFRIGMIPSGSKDPFALRRAAQGIVKILVEGELNLGLKALAGGVEKLEEFLLERVKYYCQEIRGYAYDEVAAVLAAGADDLQDVLIRLEAVKTVRASEDFEPLAAAFKRMKNILDQAKFTPSSAVDPALFTDDAEKALWTAFSTVAASVKGKSYGEVLAGMATLRPAVDLFFDKVLVNAPDQAVRANRLTLLFGLKAEFSGIAEFSEIVPQT
ncbi:glycine--tRNA ligase subunit beta [Bryobacter aggregatus]|uniref:glycine--tRNA ligase subunit beta n=1 Tax=Bryobacter aggregatus TaxID=360054 RepID=UPI0004E103C7|nr:glycine--tRNA ligase subunit beta [Bryobacter aggregatus]